MSEKVQERNRRVLEAAVAVANERGYSSLTRELVAERAEVATGSVNNAYRTMADLRDAVMAAAVERNLTSIVAAGLAVGHPAAKAAPPAVKQGALALLAA